MSRRYEATWPTHKQAAADRRRKRRARKTTKNRNERNTD